MCKVLNCIPSKNQEKDWSHTAVIKAGFVNQKYSKKFAKSVDLREDCWEVGDQGDTGSCVGWASTDGLLRWNLVKKGLLEGNNQNKLSVRFVWMSAKETDEFTSKPTTFIDHSGTSLKASLDIIKKYGCVKEDLLPFSSSELFKHEEDYFFTLAAKFRIASYHSIGIDTNEWKKWLSTEGPILARLDVDKPFKTLSSKKYKLATYAKGKSLGGHAVTIVGYTKNGYFIIRNSWGKSWGDNGFAYLSSSYVQSAFTEAYVIVL